MALPAVLLALAVSTFRVDDRTEGALVEDHRAPLVSVTVEFPAGTWSAWVRSQGADEAFLHQDDDPERTFRKRADLLAASFDLGIDDRYAAIRFRCLKADLPATMALAREILSNTRYDTHELKRARREKALTWRGNRTDVSFRLRQAVARAMFSADDPRRRPYEKPETPARSVASLIAARDALIRLPGRIIAFAGDLTPGEAEQAAGGLLPPASDAIPADLTPKLGGLAPRGGGDTDVAMRKLTQVYLDLVRDSLPWNDPRRPAFLIADHVLGGHFYSRLYVALRHEAGDTYGAGTHEDGDVATGPYIVSTFTRAENAAAIEAKLKDTLARFHDGGITEQERADAVSYLLGHRALETQSAGQILTRWLDERRLGLSPGTLDAQVESASKLTLDEVNAFIRDFYDPARFALFRAVPE